MTVEAAIAADFVHEPYLHQLKEFERSAETSALALLWQMRTGKSKVTIDTACHLFRAGLIDAVVVFAPNGVHENWLRRELPRHHWRTVEHRAIAWRTDVAGPLGVERVLADQREAWRERHEAWWRRAEDMLRSRRPAWFAFNSESMARDDVRGLLARIMRRKRVMAVFDESDDFRTPGSKRTRMARGIAGRAAYRRILTGTVITNSPLAAYSQYDLLEKGALGFDTYAAFKGKYAVYEERRTRNNRRYPKLVEYQNLEDLRERMAPWSSVVLREDCEDLPEVVRTPRRIEPTDEQLRLYRELHEQFLIDVDGSEVSVGENTNRLVKLQQVLSGFVKDEYGDIHDVPGRNPRLEALSDEVYLAPGKVIVWCQFQEDIRRVVARLKADGHEVVEYHGRVGSEDKQVAIDRFKSEPRTHMVGQPQAGGRGLDLSEADEIVNYTHTFDAIVREQAAERATAIAGANVRLTDFTLGGVDDYMLENTEAKVEVADLVAGSGMKEALGLCAL